MNISRSAKRLLMIVVLAIVVILVSKSLLSKAAKTLSVEAGKKQQTKAVKSTIPLPESAPIISDSFVMPAESSPVAIEGSANRN